ncbi:sulfur metabolite repression control protein [Pyronema omphalodes]|nr:sulfur metabolite repression control protein [Pyronema omphalodes]
MPMSMPNSPDTRRRSPRLQSVSPRRNISNSTTCDPRPTKRKRSSGLGKQKSVAVETTAMDCDNPELSAELATETKESVKRDIAPFLTRHIPSQYAPQGTPEQREQQKNAGQTSNTSFCYRHRPDLKCRRPADEPTMEQLQSSMDSLPDADRQAVTHVWSLYSVAPAPIRRMMLQGILQASCFSQLSYLSTEIRELIRIDFISTLPVEISFRILSYLDTNSLCRAAQVSRNWRALADDDVVWHKMCQQHIDRKCTKCGWGIPLMERKRLRATAKQMAMRAKDPTLFTAAITTGDATDSSSLNINRKRTAETDETSTEGGRSTSPKRPCQSTISGSAEASSSAVLPPPPRPPQTLPWKTVFSDRFKVEANWRRGRCNQQIFAGHTDGVMCVQFDDAILATGSYDTTIKIWDLATGKEIRTLVGHTQGVRCLQFDNKKLISGSMDGHIRIWNYHTGECLSVLSGHNGGILSLHFDNTLLVSGSTDHTIKVWNFADKNCYSLRGHTDWVNSVRIDTDSRTVFSASDDSTIKMWDLDTRSLIKTFTGKDGHVGHVQQVIPISLPTYQKPEPSTSRGVSPVSGPGGSNTSVGGISTIGLASNARPSTLPPASPPAPSASLSTSLPMDTTELEADPSLVASVFSNPSRPPPPHMLITASLDGTVKFWDVPTGACTNTLFGHIEGVWAVAADTLRVVSGAQDSMVKVWDVNTGACQRTITGHAGPVTCVGLSDSRMVTGGDDGVVRGYLFRCEREEEGIVGEQ